MSPPARVYRSLQVVSLRASLIAAFVAGCGPEPAILDGLLPDRGPPGTVVEVQGNLPVGLSVRWDAGTVSEQNIFLGDIFPRFFTVPLNANVGAHPVQLYSDRRYSERVVQFDVTDGVIRSKPRLDDVTVTGFGLDERGMASMILMAHGANIDAGARILINGEPQATVFYRLLRNQNLNARNPATLGRPIFHYATVWSFLIGRHPAGDVRVAVENLDGEKSNDIVYDIPGGRDELDSDGDGLLDDLEINGYDADGDGVNEVNLPELGADPMRKDLFVEVDWMEAVAPDPDIWERVEEAFRNAPVLNSDGSQGIAIHIDRGPETGGGGGDILPFTERIVTACVADPDQPWVSFYDLKDQFFDPHRLRLFRYAILAWRTGDYCPAYSGNAPISGGPNFYLTLGTHDDRHDPGVQIGTFMHELGHTLRLEHGGAERANSKDNYNSIMQYGNGAIEIDGQFVHPSPSQKGGIDVDCNLDNVDRVYTYSQGQRHALNEAELSETEGMCDGISRDWNRSGEFDLGTVPYNLDDSANDNLRLIHDYADWANIRLEISPIDLDIIPCPCNRPAP